MQLNIVTGNTIRQATKGAVHKIEVSSDLNLKNFVVVPDRFSLQMEKLIFKELNLTSTFNIDVVSISKLANLVLKLSGNEFFSQNNLEGSLLAYNILLEHHFELPSLKDANLTLELAKEIFMTISQLKSCEINPQTFKKSAEKLRSQKLIDIASVYEQYENLSREKVDAADLLLLFQKEIENCELIKNSNFYFAEFDSFTSQVATIVKLLAKSAMSVTVGVCVSKSDGNSYVYEQDLLSKLSKISEELKIIPNISYSTSKLNELQNHIVSNLFSFNQTKKEIGDKVTILSNSNVYEEVEKIANVIKFEVYKNKKEFKDFNIVLPSMNGYSSFISEIFTLEDIPFYLDETRTLNELAPIKFIYRLFEYLDNQRDVNSFLQIISDLFSELDEEDIEAVYNLIYSQGKTVSYFNSNNLEIKSEKLIKFIEKLEKINKKYEKIANFNDLIDLINEIYLQFNFKNIIDNLIEKFKLLGDLKKEKTFEQFENKFNQALKQLKNLNLNAQFSKTEMLKVVKEIFGGILISNVPLSIDAVFVGESSVSFFEERGINVFLGCNVGQMPSLQKDTGIIQDANIDRLIEIKVEPSIQMLNRRSKFKLFNDIALSREKIYISQIANAGLISEFVKSIQNMFSKNGEKLDISDDFYEVSINDSFLISQDLIFKSLLNSKKREIEKYLLNNEKSKILTEEKIENIKEILYPKNSTSISKIQKFFTCPFLHFAEYGLNLKQNELAEINPMDIGNLFHAFAQKFLQVGSNYNYKFSEEQFEIALKEAYQFALTSNERLKLLNAIPEFKGYFVYLEKETKIFAKELLKQIEFSDFKPVEFEKYFTIEICKIDNASYFLNGIVDRIDKSKDSVRVIDYKTGADKVNLTKFYQGEQLQLPIYILSLQNKNKVDGAFYFPVFASSGNVDKKLNGYFEKDTAVIKKLDKTLGPTKLKSDILMLSLLKSSTEDSFKVQARTGALEIGNLSKLTSYAQNIVQSGIEESLCGKIDALPSDVQECARCPFYSLCSFSVDFGVAREKLQSVREGDLIKLMEKDND